MTDVRLLESVEAFRDATLDAYGAVHVVCNNAGIGAGSQKPFWEQNVNDWRWTYDVNVFGVVNGINAFVPVMLEQDTEGHVVNTSSGNGAFLSAAVRHDLRVDEGRSRHDHRVPVGQPARDRREGERVGDVAVDPDPRDVEHGHLAPGPEPSRRSSPTTRRRPRRAATRSRWSRRAMKSAGRELTFAPLEEIADMTLEGIENDEFWIYARVGPEQSAQARVDSMMNKTPPDYMRQARSSRLGAECWRAGGGLRAPVRWVNSPVQPCVSRRGAARARGRAAPRSLRAQ